MSGIENTIRMAGIALSIIFIISAISAFVWVVSTYGFSHLKPRLSNWQCYEDGVIVADWAGREAQSAGPGYKLIPSGEVVKSDGCHRRGKSWLGEVEQ